MSKLTITYRLALLLLLSLVVLFLALTARTATHQGEWLPGHARLPAISHTADTITIHHVRDFRYHPDGRIRQTSYLQQQLDINTLQQVWFGISHFANGGLAHTFLSFEFSDGQYLTASVEARMRPGQDYHPVRGLLRQYHKIVVLGTEQDIIGLRSHVRQERVLLYPLVLNPAQRRHILLGIIDDAQRLHQQPAFYNTLLDNCTTNLLRHDPQYSLWKGLLDYRLLLPGHIDDYAWEHGWIDRTQPLDQQRSQALIPATIHPDAEDFSAQIRLPKYQQLSLSLLVMQQSLFNGKPIRTRGVVRGYNDPWHFWIEDHQMNRVALHPSELAHSYLGQEVELQGYFYYQQDLGRRLVLE